MFVCLISDFADPRPVRKFFFQWEDMFGTFLGHDVQGSKDASVFDLREYQASGDCNLLV